MTGAGAVRVVGVDAARCLALAGMMATHVLPAYDPATFEVGLAHQWASGRASALFAVLAGVGLALATGGTTPLRGRALGAAASSVTVRALLIAALGLTLGPLDSGVAVILAYYGVFFLLAVPFLGLRARWLYAVAVPWVVLAPVASQALRPSLPERGPTVNPAWSSLVDLSQLLSELTFTGYYPAVPWLAYLLLGMAVGRSDLRATWAPAVLVALGAGVALLAAGTSDLLTRLPAASAVFVDFYGSVEAAQLGLSLGLGGTTPTDSWWWLAVRTPHSGTPLDLAQTAGSACLVLGLALLLGRLAPRAVQVVLGAGAMTLTLYSLHVVLLATVWDQETIAAYLQHLLLALGIGAVFALLRRRGPLEALVAAVSGRVRRSVAGPAGTAVP